jgi:hypothetical protein
MADLRTIGFVRVIKDQLFAGNEFIMNSESHDEYVDDEHVRVPQSGTIPAVQKNRSSLPATIGERTDTYIEYDLNEFTTDPILIKSKDVSELSYNKRASLLKQHMLKLNDEIALEAAYQWSGSVLKSAGGQIVLMTGTATTNALPPSATGSRKPPKLVDIAACASKLDADHMPQTGRWMLMPSAVYWDMLAAEPTILSKDYNPRADADVAMGVVKILYGIKILLRPATVVYADAATPTVKVPGAAAVATDHWGCPCWHENEVARALGAIKFFADTDKPEYYGDIYSALVRFAAKATREDGKGIVTLVQDS